VRAPLTSPSSRFPKQTLGEQRGIRGHDVALPRNHKFAKCSSLSLRDLRTKPFLLLRDGHCFRDTAVAACESRAPSSPNCFESGQFSSLLSMVGAGMGISIVPEMVIEKNSPCRYLPIAEEQAVRTIGTVVLRGRPLTRAHLVSLAPFLPFDPSR
jgi:LysR family transcriptional regulator, hydrogen peroxide-inducible genes activator